MAASKMAAIFDFSFFAICLLLFLFGGGLQVILGGGNLGVAGQAPPKHIVFIVVDDMGFSDMSYKAKTYPSVEGLGPLFPTPNLDALALAGVRLESYYVHALCSPSRTALLSGRYAYNLGMNAEVIVDGVPDQLYTNIRTVADLLVDNGWNTSAYGKWDAGMTSWGCTPNCRGFQYWNGFYNAFNDYFTHIVGDGLDLRVNFEPDSANNNEKGIYMTELMTQRVTTWAKTVSESEHSFAYVAYEAIHAPQQTPESYLEGFCLDEIPDDQPTRQLACGQMRAVDASVGEIIATYDDLGMLESTLFIVTADNGGNQDTGGNNYPLRGMKASMFEGGMRGACFVSGAGLSPDVQGSINNDLFSLVDWLPTIVAGIAGVNLTEAMVPKFPYQGAPPPLDGMDVWPSLSQGAPSPRTQALLYLDPFNCFPGGGACNIPGQGAIRIGNYKLIHGHVGEYSGPVNCSASYCGPRDGNVTPNTFPLNVTAATTPPFCPTGWVPPPGSSLPAVIPPPDMPQCETIPCMLWNSTYLTGGTWLFDVVNDPFEHNDIAAQNPALVAQLLAALQAYNNTNIPQAQSPSDPASNPANFDNVWTPWIGNPEPSLCDPNATDPRSAFHSNMDGAVFISPTNVTVAGWAWSSLGNDNGTAPLNASLYIDGSFVGEVVANIFRPNLMNETGAPNPNHGFFFQLSPQMSGDVSAGKHMFTVMVRPCDSGCDAIAVFGSPICYADKNKCRCSNPD